MRLACGAALSSVLSSIVKRRDCAVRLDIGVVLPNRFERCKQASFEKIQRVFSDLYTLICLTAVRDGIELDFPGGVDARVFILEERSEDGDGEPGINLSVSGPIIDIPTLASSERPYDLVLSVESEEGEGVVREYLRLRGLTDRSPPTLRRVTGGTSMTRSQDPTISSASLGLPRPHPHQSVIVGGTFDHLHIGHKLLLTGTALALTPEPTEPAEQVPRQITIGISGDELLTKKKYAAYVESWEDRQKRTAEFFESVAVFSSSIQAARNEQHINDPGPNGKCVRVRIGSTLTINYVQISDPFGPTITEEDISALVVSKETRSGGKAVNEKRVEKGWAPLEILEVDELDAAPEAEEVEDRGLTENSESKISSTEIRKRLAEMKKDPTS